MIKTRHAACGCKFEFTVDEGQFIYDGWSNMEVLKRCELHKQPPVLDDEVVQGRVVVLRDQLHELLETTLSVHPGDDEKRCICCINIDKYHVADGLVKALEQAGFISKLAQFSTGDEPLDGGQPAEGAGVTDEPPYRVEFPDGHIAFGQTEDEIRTAIYEHQSKCDHLFNLDGGCIKRCGYQI
jgi:hypothetical protein